MQFLQTTVPDEFGPPNPEIPQNWAATRYIPWTSWRSAATIWPSASGNNSVEGEGSGMAVYAHELTHNLGLPDNYTNPYAAPFQRAATGYWSMMSRGSFGGPGGTHHRWHIPSTLGTALGSQHVIRDKIALGFVSAITVDLNRTALASGLAVEITARQVDPGDAGQPASDQPDGGDQNSPARSSPHHWPPRRCRWQRHQGGQCR
jgi:M6 family metalloprotease-like protein